MEEQFVKTAFSVLDADSLASILKNLEPEDVITFCRIKGYEELCQSDKIFRTLLRAHYPSLKIMKEGAKYTYFYNTSFRYVVRFTSEFKDTAYLVIGQYEEYPSEELYFDVRAVFEGDEVWLSIYSSGNGLEPEAYETLDDAIDDFIDNIPKEYIHLYNYMDENYVKDPHNFTKKERRDYENWLVDQGQPRIEILSDGNLNSKQVRDHIRKNKEFLITNKYDVVEKVFFIKVKLVKDPSIWEYEERMKQEENFRRETETPTKRILF